ncbi:MAG: tetratricopeptide repeat protein, partial [Pseudomonadota bacterium]
MVRLCFNRCGAGEPSPVCGADLLGAVILSDGEQGLKNKRDAALAHYRAGRFVDAIQAQMALVNEIGATSAESAEDQVRLAAFLFAHGDLPSAASVFGNAIKFRPRDAEALANYGVVLSRLRRFEEAHELLTRALKIAPDVPNTHDALASVSYRMQRFDDARLHGETALKLKDEAVAKTGTVHPIPDQPAQFSPDDPSLNIIAFSLWGDGEKYLNGALENARLAPEIYPDWRCRFYCDDTVPQAVRDQLKTLGAEIAMMNRVNPFDGLFWRFLPVNDGRTRHFLVRDADSIINAREQAAVSEWLASGKAFHVMRDWWTHTEVMLAGMWGGTGGVLPPLQTLLQDFKPSALANWHLDQWFLRSQVWPTVRQSCLIHDS